MSEKETQNESGEVKKQSVFGVIVHSFFVVPFLIAAFSVLVFMGVRLLTLEEHTVYEYLEDVREGSLNKRWQAAFELSKTLNHPESIPTDDRFIQQLTSAFVASAHDDDRIRQYLALAMGKTQNKIFITPLLDALKNAKEVNMPSIIFALGFFQDDTIAYHLYPYLKHDDPEIRLGTVMTLGKIGDRQSIPYLQAALKDEEPNVSWDAAISLASLGDDAGKPILLKLLTRKYLDEFPKVDIDEQTHVLSVSIQAARALNDPELNQAIRLLGETDANIIVKKLAMKS